MKRVCIGLALLVLCGPALAEIPAEFRIKREQVFEFASKPVVTRDGEQVTIAFESKGLCDVTVAIENDQGKIIRHLASGVLGENAPPPFEKNSKKQTIVWNGKDDTGRYVDDLARYTVRVSLGLKPQFERTLYWSPHKRIANIAPLLAASPEGVYVFEGLGVDHLRLFDHEGNYVRTIYPFPANKLAEVRGLQTYTFPQDNATLPLKIGYEQSTLLNGGSSSNGEGGHDGGFAATSMDWHDGKIAMAFHRVTRLYKDGSTGGLPLEGPSTGYVITGYRGRKETIGPTSIAFSPDGKTLYMTGYVWKTGAHVQNADCFHMVMKMDYASQAEPTLFAGVQKTDSGAGTGNDQFTVPTGIATDPKGRVYVADYVNSRIQVFAPDGKYLKTIKTEYPATVKINPKTGEIWAFSWAMLGASHQIMNQRSFNPNKIQPSVVRLGTFDKPAAGKPVPVAGVSASTSGGWEVTGGQAYKVAVDWYHEVNGEPTIWLVGRKATVTLAEANWMGGGGQWSHLGGWASRGVHILTFKDGKWDQAVDFAKIAAEKVKRVLPPSFSRSRLYVNPANEKLYICEEQTGAGKSFYTMLECNPKTGDIKEIRLPFDPEDLVFDVNGLVYLRTDREVVRYDPVTWREVPWDYGEERTSVGFSSGGGGARADTFAALAIPGRRPVWWHSSGMWISPRGELAVMMAVRDKPEERGGEGSAKDKYFNTGVSKKYEPIQFPGRTGDRVIHVFDRHGKLVHEDAFPGLTNADGLGIDNNGDLYIMVAAPRVIDGKPYFNGKSETLVKATPGKARMITNSDRAAVRLSEEQFPDRPHDLTKYAMGKTWIEGAQWFYGGVGYGGQGGSCVCWHARFQLDYFGRSFAPETMRYKVAVLDSAGNLILRIGQYGDVDDGKPLIADGGPENPRSIGGDEVALFHPAYVGTHTDRRLFITDWGNGRLLSVKLGYHASESVKVKGR